MLILGRKINESIIIGNDIKVTICKINRRQIRVGISAPKYVPVYREEVFAEINKSKDKAEKDGE